ncbi:DUF1028 domain-containing protein [Geomicrobium sediminis]|uniref:Ntn-hydrolase superfamily protein n=1 Tax=Geomicrobium sediminis TaxID=1347788 RepID=A0ABS2PA52_9BACL|nr:DUF1028 domain-containing protein [Geomicrobium sediminis]MBM7632284.1 putative Ntn-hydrolase superfamily protein [Geomicrobium sediminis]
MSRITSTFSVAGRCEKTGALGAIVTSSSPSVGARCPFVKANTGVVLTQNVTDPRLATLGLTAFEAGYTATSVIQAMASATPYPEYRQLGALSAKGDSSAHTGSKALGTHAHDTNENVVALGNLLSNESIPQSMAKTFLESEGALPDRLLAAISNGFDLGGELDQERSIALIVYKDQIFPYIDLRVDYSDNPLQDLKDLWTIYEPQADDYETRAITPETAPSYGVQGDL